MEILIYTHACCTVDVSVSNLSLCPRRKACRAVGHSLTRTVWMSQGRGVENCSSRTCWLKWDGHGSRPWLCGLKVRSCGESAKASVTLIDSHAVMKRCVLMVLVVQLLKWRHSDDGISLSHHQLTLQTCRFSSLTPAGCFKECTMTLVQVVDYLPSKAAPWNFSSAARNDQYFVSLLLSCGRSSSRRKARVLAAHLAAFASCTSRRSLLVTFPVGPAGVKGQHRRATASK